MKILTAGGPLLKIIRGIPCEAIHALTTEYIQRSSGEMTPVMSMKNREGLMPMRAISFCLILAMAISMVVPISVDDVYAASKRTTIEAYLRPEVAVVYGGVEMAFLDVNKKRVHPIFYDGSMYLPVRAVSGLLEKSIDWDNSIKAIYMGKTFRDPAGVNSGSTDSAVAARDLPKGLGTPPTPSAVLITATLRPDILFFYNFKNQSFQDVNGKDIYPITYEESNYLPVRTISDLIGRAIEWDPLNKTVTIGKDGEDLTPRQEISTGSAVTGGSVTTEGSVSTEGSVTTGGAVSGAAISNSAVSVPKVSEAAILTSAAVEKMKNIFQKQKELYNDVSNKIVDVVKEPKQDTKATIAKSISEDCLVIARLSSQLKEIGKGRLTEAETKILAGMEEFSLSLEMYALVIENIAYMNADGQDYSLLSDTLLYYALESQEKMANVGA